MVNINCLLSNKFLKSIGPYKFLREKAKKIESRESAVNIIVLISASEALVNIFKIARILNKNKPEVTARINIDSLTPFETTALYTSDFGLASNAFFGLFSNANPNPTKASSIIFAAQYLCWF